MTFFLEGFLGEVGLERAVCHACSSGVFCASRVLSIAGLCAMRMRPEIDLSNTTGAVPPAPAHESRTALPRQLSPGQSYQLTGQSPDTTTVASGDSTPLTVENAHDCPWHAS